MLIGAGRRVPPRPVSGSDPSARQRLRRADKGTAGSGDQAENQSEEGPESCLGQTVQRGLGCLQRGFAGLFKRAHDLAARFVEASLRFVDHIRGFGAGDAGAADQSVDDLLTLFVRNNDLFARAGQVFDEILNDGTGIAGILGDFAGGFCGVFTQLIQVFLAERRFRDGIVEFAAQVFGGEIALFEALLDPSGGWFGIEMSMRPIC